MNQQIADAAKQLYESTPDNVIGVGFGLKTKKGLETNAQSLIFYVQEKKSLDQLNPSEILPEYVNIDGTQYLTDIQCITRPQLVSSCYTANDATSADHRSSRTFLQGGISISLDTLSVPYAGTLGAIVRDNEDGSIVALTNAHVALFNMDRAYINSQKNLMSSVDLANWNTENKGFAQAGAIDGWGPTFGHVKRYAHIDPSSLVNKVDAAIVSISDLSKITTNIPDEFYTVLGYRDPGQPPSSIRTNVAPLFNIASSADIETIISGLSVSPIQSIAKSGRTTGYIMSRALSNSTEDCYLQINGWHAVLEVGFINSNFSTEIVTFNDVLSIRYSDISVFNSPIDGIPYAFPRENIVVPGDSGSIVYAYINGVPKIIGLIFAAGSYVFPGTLTAPLDYNIGYFVRIDKVCEALNISAIDNLSNITVNPESNWTYITQSGPSDDSTITIGGSKYWQVGMTNAGADSVYVTYSPPVSPTPSPSVSVSSSVPVTPSVTPSISVSTSVGATPTPTPTPTMSITPTNSASSLCCIVGDFEFDLVCEITPSPTQSATQTPTPTPSISASSTPPPSPSASPPPSPSASPPPTPSPSPSASPPPSPSPPLPSPSPTEPPTESPY